MKLRLILFFLGLLIGGLAPTQAGAAESALPHDLLCNGPIANIADDDPGLALFADSSQPLIDRKIALAIERANSCNEEDRNPFDRVRDLLDELALPEPGNGQIRALLYEIETEGQFVCDDQPARCFGDEDSIPVPRAEYEAITARLCGPNGSVSRDDQGPVCSDPPRGRRHRPKT